MHRQDSIALIARCDADPLAKSSSRGGFRQTMARVHIWAGLLPGWLLFLISLFGTAAFFSPEISGWMRPELQGRTASPQALARAEQWLARHGAGAESWTILLPSARGGDPLSVAWRRGVREDATGGSVALDPATGRELAIRDTRGGAFLFSFHYNLYYMPWWVARYLVCIATLSMLVANLSGIVTHRRIFADFFMLRLGKGQRSWLDAHNGAAVVALPFHLVMTYTGLVALFFTIMPWAALATYPDRAAMGRDFHFSSPPVTPDERAAPVAPLRTLVAQGRVMWAGEEPTSIEIKNPGRADAVAMLFPDRSSLGVGHWAVFLKGATGEPVPGQGARGAATATLDAMIDLHIARYADPVLRWLYFLSGVIGTAMIATGLILWTVKRRDRLHAGLRLVDRLNIGFLAGAPAGIAAYFLANRLLPIGLAGRDEWEIRCLFLSWGALFAWTACRPVRKAWAEALYLCAALYALIPLVNGVTTPRGLLPSLARGDGIFAGFDMMMWLIAAFFGFAAHKVGQSPTRARA